MNAKRKLSAVFILLFTLSAVYSQAGEKGPARLQPGNQVLAQFVSDRSMWQPPGGYGLSQGAKGRR